MNITNEFNKVKDMVNNKITAAKNNRQLKDNRKWVERQSVMDLGPEIVRDYINYTVLNRDEHGIILNH